MRLESRSYRNVWTQWEIIPKSEKNRKGRRGLERKQHPWEEESWVVLHKPGAAKSAMTLRETCPLPPSLSQHLTEKVEALLKSISMFKEGQKVCPWPHLPLKTLSSAYRVNSQSLNLTFKNCYLPLLLIFQSSPLTLAQCHHWQFLIENHLFPASGSLVLQQECTGFTHWNPVHFSKNSWFKYHSSP